MDPEAHLGDEVTGEVAVVSTGGHGIYFEQRCEGRYGFIVIDTSDQQQANSMNALLQQAEMRPPSQGTVVLEAVATGTINRTRKGGWGLKNTKFRELRLIPVQGSGYRGVEAIEEAARRQPPEQQE